MNKKNPAQLVRGWLASLLFLFLLINSATAEDTEIFRVNAPPKQTNILFTLDGSGSMLKMVTGTDETRENALKQAFSDILTDELLVDVGVGLIGFSFGWGKIPYPQGISVPITPIDDKAKPVMLSNTTSYNPNGSVSGNFTLADDNLPDPGDNETIRNYLPRVLNSWQAFGNTPIVDALHEAALYFRGEQPKWGAFKPEQNQAAHPSTYTVTGSLPETTGNTAICETADCGINCVGFTEQDICPTGDLSCGLGINCATATEPWGEICTVDDCLASNPKFTSCTTTDFGISSCLSSCASGIYHSRTKACLPDALDSFIIETHGPNMCLEAYGSELTQETCDGTAEQIFYSTQARPDYVQIHSSNNKCIGPQSAAATSMGLYACSAAENQTFKISGGTISADPSEAYPCLGINNGSTSAGAKIIRYRCHGASSQSLIPTSKTTACGKDSTTICEYPKETRRCDHQKYSCDEVSDTQSDKGVTYNSPIDKCSNNAIVLLSDGEPVSQAEDLDQTWADIKKLTGITEDCVETQAQKYGNDNGRCGRELVRFLTMEDQSDSVDGVNTIDTYTIGFDVEKDSVAEIFLTGIADAGSGKYFPAANAAALVAVFKSIITDVSKNARSFAAPVYTVDPSSRLAHSRNIYIPLFENSAAPRWSGNLKKFKLDENGKIVGKTGKVAIDGNGILDPEAIDFWVKGSENTVQEIPNAVTSGGVASLLVPGSRNLLTDSGSALVPLDSSSVSKQAIKKSNLTITDEHHEELIKFIQGYNGDGTARHHIGDILHSKPTVVTYADKEVIFFGTNEGYLHAFDTADADDGGGKELFGFMPSKVLHNIRPQYKNKPRSTLIKRLYGVDGEMTVWINDLNNNGKVDGPGETAYLYFGLRRGGKGYYAIDVTIPSEPKLLWKIDNKTTQFHRLGQTWSKPTMGKLRYIAAGAVKFEEVLVFGGGYHPEIYDKEDVTSRPSIRAKGDGIYIVNARTGKRVWARIGGKLQHSIPSKIRVLDVDRDGSIDRLYFGDTGGNVWRADLNVDDFDDDVSLHDVKKDGRIYKLASLGSDDLGSDTRKFFHEPDASLFKHKGRIVSLVTIGSGYRSHPNNTDIKDRLYVLYDENALNIPKDPPPTLTDNGRDLADSSTLAGKDFLPDYKGWYKDLVNGTGEKSLSSPLIFRDKVMFTTFGLTGDPVSIGGVDGCDVRAGNFSRAYALDLMTGSAVTDLDGDGVVTDKDESIVTGYGEILDSPKLVFNKPSNCTNEGCDHIIDVRIGNMPEPLIDGDTVDGNVNVGEYLPKVFWLDSPE